MNVITADAVNERTSVFVTDLAANDPAHDLTDFECAIGLAAIDPTHPDVVAREDVSGIIRLHRIETDLPSDVLRKVFTEAKVKNSVVYGHGQRVALYAMVIGARLGLPEDRLFSLGVAAWLHDIGKLSIPREILDKEVKLTPKEWDYMRQHPSYGRNILKMLGAEGYARVAFGHHERYDGQGYHGIPSHSLDIETQITCVADAYDAVTSRRCYRGRASHHHAMQELATCSGSQFTPAIAAVAVSMGPELNRIRAWAWLDQEDCLDSFGLGNRIDALVAV